MSQQQQTDEMPDSQSEATDMQMFAAISAMDKPRQFRGLSDAELHEVIAGFTPTQRQQFVSDYMEIDLKDRVDSPWSADLATDDATFSDVAEKHGMSVRELKLYRINRKFSDLASRKDFGAEILSLSEDDSIDTPEQMELEIDTIIEAAREASKRQRKEGQKQDNALVQ